MSQYQHQKWQQQSANIQTEQETREKLLFKHLLRIVGGRRGDEKSQE